MEARALGPLGVKWLLEPMDINKANATVHLKTRVLSLSIVQRLPTLQAERHYCFTAEMSRVMVLSRADSQQALPVKPCHVVISKVSQREKSCFL